MDFGSIAGIVGGLVLVLGAIVLGGNVHNFINIPSIMIVLGGTVAGTLITFPLPDVIKAFRAAWFVFKQPKTDPNSVVFQMVRLSHQSRREGLLAIGEVKTTSRLLEKACRLIADGATEEVVRSALRKEIESVRMRHYVVHDVFRKMGTYAPAFGMLGTLIGLVQMLSQLSDPTSIGPSMAVALLTTFYGSFLSSLIFLPLAGKLKARTVNEMINREIIFEGAISIINGENPIIIYEKVSSYIPDRLRKEYKTIGTP